MHLDVTSEDSWTEAVAAAGTTVWHAQCPGQQRRYRRPLDPAQGLSTDAWDRLMDVNARGVFLGIKHAIPEMRKAGIGSIVNISSISGFIGQTGLPRLQRLQGRRAHSHQILRGQTRPRKYPRQLRAPRIMPPMRDQQPALEQRVQTMVPMRRWDAAKKWQTRCCSWPRMRRPISPAPNWWSTAGIWHCRDESMEMLGIRDELRYNGLHHACTT